MANRPEQPAPPAHDAPLYRRPPLSRPSSSQHAPPSQVHGATVLNMPMPSHPHATQAPPSTSHSVYDSQKYSAPTAAVLAIMPAPASLSVQPAPSSPTHMLEDLVYHTVHSVGRLFSAQIFNTGKDGVCTPATIAVAADHLIALLIKGAYTRIKAAGLSNEARFGHALWELHSTVFLNYETAWVPRVGLTVRPTKCTELMAAASFLSADVLHGLLAELSLYFVLYSEAANMRHTPEVLWFCYYTMVHSPAMVALWAAGGAGDMAGGVPGARQRAVVLRNSLNADICAAQRSLVHDPRARSLEECEAVYTTLAAGPGSLLDTLLPPSLLRQLSAGDRVLVADLIAHGDGGALCDRLITPIFYVLSYEMDYLTSIGTEMAHRLGYCDVNESLATKSIVRATLGHLGVSKEALKTGSEHDAYAAILALGVVSAVVAEGESEEQKAVKGVSLPGVYDPQLAAAWWSEKVFVKTFLERRSWTNTYLAFYRIYSLHLVAIHLMFAQAIAPNNLVVLSSAVITHAWCAAAERFCAWWMTAKERDPLAHAHASGGWMRAAPTTAATAADAASVTLANGRRQRVQPKTEGAPLFRVFGLMEWILVAFAITAFFVLRFIGPEGLMKMAHSYWLFAAGGYTAVHAAHWLLTSRDGYVRSLTSMLHLPSYFTASSARPEPVGWLPGQLGIGAASTAWTIIFWIQVLALKFVFDFFVIIKPVISPIRIILRERWLSCADNEYNIAGFSLPCIGGAWLLISIRLLPFIIVMMVDTQIAFQLVMVSWGAVHGLFRLNLGVVGDWSDLQREFHRAPMRWWRQCMSGEGNDNTLKRITARRDAALGAATEPLLLADGNANASSSEADAASLGSAPSASISASGTGADDDSALNSPAMRSRSMPGRFSRHGSANSLSGLAIGKSMFTSASGLSAASSKKKMGSRASRNAASMQLMLLGQSDEQVAMWDAFAVAWDEIVNDLREADYLSDAEAAQLRFVHLEDTRVLEAAGVRPILLPAFFYAGQVQRVLDTGLVNPPQQLVLAELRNLMTWLGCTLGLLNAQAVSALSNVVFRNTVIDLPHAASRESGMKAAVTLLKTLRALQAEGVTTQEVAGRAAAGNTVVTALGQLMAALEVECRAVLAGPNPAKNYTAAAAATAGKARSSWWGGGKAAAAAADTTAVTDDVEFAGGGKDSTPTDMEAARVLLRQLALLRVSLVDNPSTVLAACSMLHWEVNNNGSDTDSLDGGSNDAFNLALTNKVLGVLTNMLTAGAGAGQPSGGEARRVLSFFITSLSNNTMRKPLPLDEMMSWTVLTPCYEEDVLHPLEGEQKGGPLTLLKESEDCISLMTYLRSVFPKDWDCFAERMSRASGIPASDISEASFAKGGPLEAQALQVQLWASFRSQHVARTARGMMAYAKSLRLLGVMEHPRQPGQSLREYNRWLDSLVESKFSFVVSAQTYGRNRSSTNPKEQWLAQAVDIVMKLYPSMEVAFLDMEANNVQYSVLASHCETAVGGVREVYRVRLPQNIYSKRGIIIGEGKPENQNHAIIFAFGEGLQTIDMNQDNELAEALKVRSMLAELTPESATAAPIPTSLGTTPAAGSIKGGMFSRRKASAVTAAGSAAGANGEVTGTPLAAAVFRKQLVARRMAESPVALVGFREHIFSDKAGALASFAASAEFSFGTICQRMMCHPAQVRLHYGHPDIFNKLHVMTRGGLSKATKQLHISEDIFGGFNHTLRGGKIRYAEFMSVGKGRDMGFSSILGFETKIASGLGELLISRDNVRLATRLDIWRLMHMYFSSSGHYINTLFMLTAVWAQIFALVFFSLTRTNDILSPMYRTYYADGVFTDSTSATDSMGHTFGAPKPPGAEYTVKKEGFALATALPFDGLLQLGMLSLLPYVVENCLELGFGRGLWIALSHFASGSFFFFLFRMQTSAFMLWNSITYGGGKYIGTGREFSISTSSFLRLFTMYGRSHLYFGMELAALALTLAVTQDCVQCSYFGLTWGVWLVAVSCLLSPFWFNPLSFSATKIARDFQTWAQFLRGETDPDTGLTWAAWNRKSLALIRNEAGNQTDHRMNILVALIQQALPPALLAFAAASRIDLEVHIGPNIVRSPFLVFALLSAILWVCLASVAAASRRFAKTHDQRGWRMTAFCVSVALVVVVALYLWVASRWFTGSPIANLLVFIYGNLMILMSAHRAATHLCNRSPRMRAVVDAGYHTVDMLIGYFLLAVLSILSGLGVASLQTRLLFNGTFARNVKRGALLALGLAPANKKQSTVGVSV